MKPRVILILATLLLLNTTSVGDAADFDFTLQSVHEKRAEQFVVEKVNIRSFTEPFKPFVSYWGVTENDKPAKMTFRFPLIKPMRSAQLHAEIVCANFQNNKSIGSGTGSGSLWCSRDGKSWIQLINATPPVKTSLDVFTFHGNLPPDLKGTTEIWLQFRLHATGMKDPTYSVAQFARKRTEDPNSRVFGLRVRYDEKASTPATPSPLPKPTG